MTDPSVLAAPPSPIEPSHPSPPGPAPAPQLPVADGQPPIAGRHRRPGSAARLASIHALILAVVLGGSVIAMVRNFQLGTRQLVGRQLAAELQTFRDATVHRPAGDGLFTFAQDYLRGHALAAGETVVIDVVGTGTVGSPGAADPKVMESIEGLLAASTGRSRTGTQLVGGRDTEYLTVPLTEGGRQMAVFVGTADLSSFDSVQSRIFGVSVTEAALALAVGVASAFVLLRRLLRTVGRITTTADRIGRGRLHERLGDQGTDDEVGQLAGSFDAMLDRVEGAVDAQQQLLSDVSHQLRTPLTVVRGHLEVLARTDLGDAKATGETLGMVLGELDQMRGLIERLSLLGQAMEPDSLTVEDTDLRELLGDLYEAAAVLAPRHWVLRDVDDAIIQVDGSKVRGALLNLVDNAIKATSPGDRIEFSGRVSATGEARLCVADSGPGIPPAARAAVLGRFSRPGARRAGGSGLGLAIVKAVAEAHGGRVEVGASALGGAAVTIVVPGREGGPACGS